MYFSKEYVFYIVIISLTCQRKFYFRKKVLCSVLQDSVIGSYLWNIFYDDLLRLAFHKRVELVRFVDEIALVIIAFNANLLENMGNSALGLVNLLMQENGLQVVSQNWDRLSWVVNRPSVSSLHLRRALNSSEASDEVFRGSIWHKAELWCSCQVYNVSGQTDSVHS